MVHNLAIDNPEVHLLYVGNENQFPEIDLPAASEITWAKVSRTGTPSTEITGYAKEVNADLIVMVTSGKRSLWDMLTGSTVQNVLKNAPCPVFTLPVE
jgi:nucleotide-binding universal stress UspA family protein